MKIGAKTYGPDATELKKAREDSKYVGTKPVFGFSVLGMIVHSLNPESGLDRIKLDRSFGLNLKSDEVESVPEIFFDFKIRLKPDLRLHLYLFHNKINDCFNLE